MSQVNGQSYSPQSAQEGVTAEAKKEGFRISAMTLPFSAAATYFAAIRKSGPLHKFTNVSSRTALVIMPPFFAFALASEMSIVHQKVSEEASDEHTRFKPANSLNPPHSASLRYASQKVNMVSIMKSQEPKITVEQSAASPIPTTIGNKFTDLDGNNWRVVDGDLRLHHKVINFAAAHPFKTLVGAGAPVVGSIFYYQQQQAKSAAYKLKFSQKVMHARVFGQFFALSLLVSVMGVRELVEYSGGMYLSASDKFLLQKKESESDQRFKEHLARKNQEWRDRGKYSKSSEN